MYKIKNGILYKNNKKTFVLGESYYPSFHPSKFPVPPEGDRIGEMIKDLKMMAEAGFNHVRFAALGETFYNADNDSVSIDSPLIDAMCQEADKNNLSVSIRLQGFSVNLRGFTDDNMLDENGKFPDYEWCDFVRSSPNHQGILEDNFVHSRDLAKHYREFSNVVGYQIYNEPKLPQPSNIITDYNPHSIKAYRKWLVDKQILTESEAKQYTPPRGRRDQSPRMWALWRKFMTESLNGFLNNASNGAKAGADLPTFTCLTADCACKTNPRRGVDPFANAKGMDFVGYTIYLHANNADYHRFCLEGDIFQSAAHSEGKEAWCIELDSRTYIPCDVYNKGTYVTIGSGVKGIVYYQWRGDCPVPGVPNPNSCGILNYDGTKTDNFENALNVNRWIIENNDLIMNADKAMEGVGLFYSQYAVSLYDAFENDDYKPKRDKYYNAYAMAFETIYTDIRRTGYTVTIVDAEHLAKSELNAIIVPDLNALNNDEKAAIKAFFESGKKVYVNRDIGFGIKINPGFREFGWKAKNLCMEKFAPIYTPYDLPDLLGYKPIAVTMEPLVGVQVLTGKDYTLLVLTNSAGVAKTIDARVRVNVKFNSAEFTAIDGTRPVEINGDELTIRNITDGGMIILR